MATTREIRLEDMVRIHDPAPNAPPRVLGEWPGNPTSNTRVLVNRVIGATEKFLRGAWDIRGNRNFGPIEAGERLREISGPTLKELDATATELRTQREKLRETVRAINTAKPYEQLGHWQAQIDLRLLDAFNALPGPQKAAMKDRLLAEPMLHWDLADAMLRLPLLVTGLQHAEQHTIKTNLFKSVKPDQHAALSEQMEQLAFAESAVRVAVDTAVQTTGSGADVAEHAPAALALAQPSEPLGWGT
jgi:hypothetical protein